MSNCLSGFNMTELSFKHKLDQAKKFFQYLHFCLIDKKRMFLKKEYVEVGTWTEARKHSITDLNSAWKDVRKFVPACKSDDNRQSYVYFLHSTSIFKSFKALPSMQ